VTFNTRTDDNGEFELQGVVPSDYEFSFFVEHSHALYHVPRPEESRIKILGGEDAYVGDFAFRLGPVSVSGRVVNQEGDPVDSVLVLCYRDPGGHSDEILLAKTNANGEYCLAGLPREHVVVQAGLSGYTGYADLELAEPAPHVRLNLETADTNVVLEPFVLLIR